MFLKQNITKTIYVPLAYNHSYHKKFKYHDLEKEHYVSLSPKGKLNIGLVNSKKVDYYFNPQGKKVACDLNVRDNFLTYFDGNIVREYDYDRKYVNQFVKELQKLDKLPKEEKHNEENQKKLEKLIRINTWYFKNLISTILVDFKNQNVNEIVLEDLDLSKTSASYIKNEEFKIKYSRLIRMLRLSKIKDWFVEQARKHGIAVHLTNPAFSSQECSECHYIHKKNRNKDLFFCLNCGHKEHSDYNSTKTLYNRTEGNVSLSLHNSEIFFGFTVLRPKTMNHSNIQKVIHRIYNFD
jgi:putative transposase